MTQSSKLWTKDFIIIFLTNFFTHVVFYLLMVMIAIFTATKFNVSQSVAGFATGIFVLASLLARIFTGKYLDRFGRKKMLVYSLIVFVIAMILHLYADQLYFLLIIRFIHGAMHGCITTAAGAIAADLIPDDRRGEGTGYYSTAMNIAMAFGPFLGMFLYERTSFTVIFMVGIVVSLFDLIVICFLKPPQKVMIEEHQKGFYLKDFIEPKAVPISASVFLITLAYASLLSFLTQYARDVHLVSASSFFFIVYAVALIITRPFTGKWFDLFGANRLNYPLLLVVAVGFFLLCMVQNSFMFLLSAVFIGIGYGTLISNFQAIAIQESPSHRKSLATSTFFMFLDLSNGIGPYLVGVLVTFIPLKMVYGIVAIWIFVCLFVYYLVYGKRVKCISER